MMGHWNRWRPQWKRRRQIRISSGPPDSWYGTPAAERPRCGARTRTGRPCRAPVAWDHQRDRPVSDRCRMHGGWSTGPRTDAGKAAIADSNRRRAVVRDLVQLAELEEGQAKRWAAAVVELAKGRGLRPAGRAAGVSHETVRRWRQSPSFIEAERRARARWERRPRKAKPSRRPRWRHPKECKSSAAELRWAIETLERSSWWL